MIRAIDVSQHQGDINWSAVAESGVQGAWIKVGGADGPAASPYYRDPFSAANIADALLAGLAVGTYYFASPRAGDGYRQAVHAHDCGLGLGDLPPALDLETANGLSGNQLDLFALDFLATADRLCSANTIVYTGVAIGSPAAGYFGTDSRLGSHPLWIANWGANRPSMWPPSDGTGIPVPPAWATSRWSIWQHNSVTMTPGIIANRTDQDVVADNYWAAITAVPSEWRMKRILIQGEAQQWRLVDDAFGVQRRQPIDSMELVHILEASGVTDGEIELTNPAEIDRFRRIPAVTGPTAEWGIIGIVAKGVEQVGVHLDQHQGQPVDAVALGDTLANHLADHLRE